MSGRIVTVKLLPSVALAVARRQGKLFLVALGALLVAAFGVAGKALGGGHPPLEVVVGILIGVLFVAVGCWSRVRWPDERTGLLLVLTGYGWLAEDLVTSDVAVVFTLGALLVTASPPLLLHLVLAYPSGRLESRAERAVVGLGYVFGFGLSAAGGMLARTDPQICRCPENLLVVDDNHELAATLTRVRGGGLVLLTAVAALILFGRWRTATPRRRRVMAPFVGAAVLLGVVGVLYGIVRWVLAIHAEWLLASLNEIGRVALLALPVAFLIGRLREEAAHAAVIGLLPLLERRPSAADLRDALARALGDGRLELGRWDDAAQCYVDHIGRELALPTPGDLRTATDVRYGDRRLAVVVHDSSLCADPELVEAVAAAARIALLGTLPHAMTARQTLPGITGREWEVLALMASGLGNRAIAQRLSVSERTVETHVKSIFRKLGLPPVADRDNRRVRAVLAFLGSTGLRGPS
jgi:DNA-binding CsgD family transcriptional regulator